MQEIIAEQESGAQGSTVEEIQAKIEQCIKESIGRTHCTCGEPIHPEEIEMYPHESGIEIRSQGRQWVYIHCPKCGYDWALWKLRMKLDEVREDVVCQPRREEKSKNIPQAACEDVNCPASTAQDQLAHYTACVFEPTDIVELRRLPSGKSTWHKAGRLAEAAESLVNENQNSQHIYASANPRRAKGGTKSTDVVCARCLFADFDGIDFDAAQARWQNASLPKPTLTIGSGHGVHAYWGLAEPITDMAQWTVLQKKLIALLDSDGAIHDPARIMRLPGFINHKEPTATCSIIDSDQARIYDLKTLMPVLNKITLESKYSSQPQPSGNPTAQTKPVCNGPDVIKRAVFTAAKWDSAPKGRRNCAAFQHAAYLVKNLELTEEQAWPVMKEWNLRNKPPLPERELRQSLRNAIIYGRHRYCLFPLRPLETFLPVQISWPHNHLRFYLRNP